ncbi:MAG: tetratricopeptide repeat protein [Actinobacteria bacterium]|nr:tetratricopeptide repeat protein [Actinomycetota bacterium]
MSSENRRPMEPPRPMNEVTTSARRIRAAIESGDVTEAISCLSDSLRSSIEEGPIGTGVAVLTATVGSFEGVGRVDVVADGIEELLDIVDADSDPIAVGRLCAVRAGLARSSGRYSDAIDDQSTAIELLEDRVSATDMATLRHDCAVLLGELGLLDDAVNAMVVARETFLGLRDRVGVAAADHNLGFLLHDLGSLDDAIEYFTEARDIFLAIDMPEEAAACDQNLGVVFYDAGRLKEAGRRFAVAYRRFREVDALTSAGECDANLATLLRAMGRPAEAAHYQARAEAAGVGVPLAPGMSTEQPVVRIGAHVVDHAPGTSGSASA